MAKPSIAISGVKTASRGGGGDVIGMRCRSQRVRRPVAHWRYTAPALLPSGLPPLALLLILSATDHQRHAIRSPARVAALPGCAGSDLLPAHAVASEPVHSSGVRAPPSLLERAGHRLPRFLPVRPRQRCSGGAGASAQERFSFSDATRRDARLLQTYQRRIGQRTSGKPACCSRSPSFTTEALLQTTCCVSAAARSPPPASPPVCSCR